LTRGPIIFHMRFGGAADTSFATICSFG